MSSLDNLVAEILQQAEKEANRILVKVKAENLEFTENENKKIQKEIENIQWKTNEEAISLKERIISNANLKSRDMVLQAKEELVDKVLKMTLERLKNLDSDSYLDFVENALKTLNISKNAEIILTKKMKDVLGKEIFGYKVSDDIVESGCNIKDENVIYNNEFSSLLEFNKEDLEREILKKIFG
ncbi:V-type ATP synthase subunit E [Fusobacterium nucleatum]|uniref:V-type ATP synthase subunit E n=1 Tax=Fusobacterium nucleatum TaxID=851 RepID=UPI0004000916|nr:V-type ATP synthase subunit E [Fusobacterium nucleatum]ALF23170.1 ATP synthase subunit E [Fusobacterium nucleatum subsp. nucleatum ChDC F316]ASG25606.1 V-type ATP synthase subunit E [Fusobacterium nucleatum subsp. nucleatum]